MLMVCALAAKKEIATTTNENRNLFIIVIIYGYVFLMVLLPKLLTYLENIHNSANYLNYNISTGSVMRGKGAHNYS